MKNISFKVFLYLFILTISLNTSCTTISKSNSPKNLFSNNINLIQLECIKNTSGFYHIYINYYENNKLVCKSYIATIYGNIYKELHFPDFENFSSNKNYIGGIIFNSNDIFNVFILYLDKGTIHVLSGQILFNESFDFAKLKTIKYLDCNVIQPANFLINIRKSN